MQRHRLLLLGIILIGAVLRLWTTEAGLPYSVGVDEPALLEKSVHIMKTGDFHPHFWDYGGVTIYLHTAVSSARFLAGAMNREWTSLEQAWTGEFYHWARVVTALISTLTIYIVFRIGLRWGATIALIAAVAMAVQPQLVREAHFALTDTPLTFFVALTGLLSLRASEAGTLRWFFAAGLAAGLSAATKYPGALGIVMPLAAVLTTVTWRGRAISALVVLGGALAGFVVATPYAMTDLPGFLNGFARLMQYYNVPRPFSEVATTYLKYIRDWFGYQPVLPRYFALPALLLCLAGFVVIATQLRSQATRAGALILLTFPIAYFAFVSNQSLQFGRYLMPIVPTLSIAIAAGIVTVHGALARNATVQRSRTVLAALLLVLLPPALTSISANANRGLESTIEQTGRWIVQNVKPEQRVVFEEAMQLPPKIAHERVNKLIASPLQHYRDNGTVYLIASSGEYDKYFNDPNRFGREIGAYNEIFRSNELVATFAPSAEHPGPTIRIMRVAR